ncbi:hypothetical protein [Bradyrhizobium sp.]|jgi:hypothetical protein|uniref:hypothetical protein n=1 Tax=Bradyrhizobium sp. TaxID=376 RepID=UPI002E01CF16|nr:hypothetical protein [Bradyrhizobium sp.]
MSPNDTNEVNALKTMATAIALPNDLNNTVTKNVNCPHESWRDNYNHEVVALTGEMIEVSGHLASLNKMQTEVSRAAWQSIQALNNIEKRLAAYPPAMPPGTVLPLDMYVQKSRGGRGLSTSKPAEDGIDVVLAHLIPQANAMTSLSIKSFRLCF